MTAIQTQIIFPNFQVVKRVNLKVQVSDNESNISIPTTEFSKNDHQPRIPPFIGNPGLQFAVENEADMMIYFDHYIPPEFIETVVDQTNLYAQQQIAKMPCPITKQRGKGREGLPLIPRQLLQ